MSDEKENDRGKAPGQGAGNGEAEIEFIKEPEAESGADAAKQEKHARKKARQQPAQAGEAVRGGRAQAAAETSEPEAQALLEVIKAKDEEIAALRRELDGFKDLYLRKLADMDNLRKRLEREKDEYYQYALSDLLAELLAIIDNLERALERPEEEADGKSFREGVELIYRMFKALLAKNGVQDMDTTDRKFDPNIHHATSVEEVEGLEEPEIGEILQKGYFLNKRLLRPAMVKVLMPKKS
jgi:molecular chaperone GrpE